jgi:CRP/FNR family cyclic AMP-dependent transcriptional regulator
MGEPDNLLTEDPHRAFLQLRELDTLGSFTDDQLAGLAAIAERTRLHPGQMLFEEGDEGEDVYLLVDGDVEVVRQTAVGEQTVAQLRSGTLVGEISFLDGGPRTGTVVGWFASELLGFRAPALRHLATNDHAFALALLRTLWQTLAGKIRQANGYMAAILTSTGERQDAEPGRGERVRLDLDAKLAVLREQGLAAAHLDAFARTMRTEWYRPESFLFTEGDIGQALYVVADGQVRISRRLPGMGEEALAILGRGEVFGEMALIDDKPRSADARAGGVGCTVLSVNWERLERLLEIEPEVGYQFLSLLCRMLCRRLRAMNSLLVAWRTMAGFG